VQARMDAPRGERPERSGPPARSFDREHPRSFDGGDRAPRSGPPRGDRPDRGERPARPFNSPPRKFDRDAGGSRPPRPSRPRRDDA
jgi:23S rRNA pseudouridine2605 synthase